MTNNHSTKRYILPLYFNGAPNPSVMIELEIRPVNWMNGGKTNVEGLGYCNIYMDSQYNPIADRVKKVQQGDFLKIDQAEAILKEFGCIPVKDDFDRFEIEDLREIKHLLSPEWIVGFNQSLNPHN